MVSNRLKADCLDCGTGLLLSDIPFEQWVKLDYGRRGQVAGAYLQQVRMTAVREERIVSASVRARKVMEGLLGEPVPSNQPDHEDTGYDY